MPSLASDMPATDVVARGILCRLGAVVGFSFMSAMLKLASLRGMNAPELVFWRSTFSLPVVLAWVLRRYSLEILRPNNVMAHVSRSAIGLASMTATFQALILLPLGDATTINFTAPLFATILSFVLLKEPVGRHRWAAVLVGFVGVIIVAHPSGAGLPLLGVAIALAAAVGQASVTITLRRLQRSEHVGAIVFWFAVAGILVGGLLMPVFGHAHETTAFVLVALGGLAGGTAQLLMTASLRAPVSAVTPFDYLQMVGALLFGWLFFATMPTAATLGGAALIAGSGLYTAVREHRLRRRSAPAVLPAA
ncbi:DMT family transporter [Sphingomonas ginkgonis]|uniref:DMT family transporter n=1 Tax=Sphingomonas ginkgonis TaxID=2315330 RepID=A0A429VAT1_9SPHN|nr:DMT family transporter [Sphingomonas ginkgonis]RST31058.1 DMT family transporter [Sphingomonas ginkgonis]